MMHNFANFTPRAQRVIQLARREADNFNHPYIGTEHLLLGLVALGEGVAVDALEGMDISVEVLRIEVGPGSLFRPRGMNHEQITFRFQGLDQRLTGTEESTVQQAWFG